MNVLGPDYRQVRLRRGQNDAVRQGQLEVVTEPGGFEGQGGVQRRDLTLVHGGRGLEGRILALCWRTGKTLHDRIGKVQRKEAIHLKSGWKSRYGRNMASFCIPLYGLGLNPRN